jgi:pimeloyl-ACP methyl ester carboxylesterase
MAIQRSGEQFAEVGGGIDLCHETIGDPKQPPVVMIMGIGTQMLAWPDGFCELLAARGAFVIRFDNRDSGRSTSLDHLGVPSVTKAWRRELDDPPYLLSDMASDVVGLLAALGHDSAHVVGSSLGGFVAQTMAIEHPDRVRSLASIMSSTGSGKVGYPTQEAMEVLMTRPPADLESYLDGIVAARRVIGSPGFPLDEAWLREAFTLMHGRGINPEGTQRQLVASICSGNRTDRLRELAVPTVVIHGAEDKLIDVSGGKATAAAIPDAELVLIERMGHDLPKEVWPRIVDAISGNFDRAKVT